MHPYRQMARWTLTLLALLLAMLALLLLLLRLLLHQIDLLGPQVEYLLEARTGAAVELGALSGGLSRFDPSLEGHRLSVTTQRGEAGLPLLDVEHLRLRLDAAASLRAGVPVVEDRSEERRVGKECRGRRWPVSGRDNESW